MAGRLAEIEETMRREHERAAHREQVIDRLHAENQDLRHGLLQEALAPVRAALYRLYDTAGREAVRLRECAPPSAEHMGALLEAIADEVAEVLGRTGAERLVVKPGDVYDPAVHRPIRVRAVEADADGTVVEVLAEGFLGVATASGGAPRERVLRKASVVVGRTPQSGATNDSSREKMTPDDQGAEGVGPEGTGPEGVGPEGARPKGVGPEGVGPEGVGRKGVGPEGVEPEGADADGEGREGARDREDQKDRGDEGDE